eukprot:3358529-Prymnesium_polylepis.3
MNIARGADTWNDADGNFSAHADTQNGIRPRERDVIQKAYKVRGVIRQIKRPVIRALREPFFIEPEEQAHVYIVRDQRSIPAIYQGNDKYEKIWIDSVGVGHETGKTTTRRGGDMIIEAQNGCTKKKGRTHGDRRERRNRTNDGWGQSPLASHRTWI